MRNWRSGFALSWILSSFLAGMILAGEQSLIVNPDFQERKGNAPAGYALRGDVSYQFLGDAPRIGRDGAWRCTAAGHDRPARYLRSLAFPREHNAPFDSPSAGCRRMDLSLRGMGDSGWVSSFSGKTIPGAMTANDSSFIPQSNRRKDLAVNGDNHVGGAAAWRTYSMEFIVPFPQVTRLKLSVALQNGMGSQNSGDFYIGEFGLTPIPSPAGDAKQSTDSAAVAHIELASPNHLVPIGGRWFYAAKPDETHPPDLFAADNADRLLYFDGQYETPFVGNMNSVLRKGEKDREGHIAGSDTAISDNVTVRFDSTSLIIHTRGLPNHPTGLFPATGFGLMGNPNYIIEQDSTYYLPLEPKEREGHTITDRRNSNHALNMGPIGIAANGIVFFNPFDADSQDATNFMDSCCGHPNPFGQYHYHKYPICVNTPWSDDGDAHSPLLGFAFDGFPIYGPYESKGVMARDLSGENKLNGFNMHYDPQRGWHYHVTPGQFPYIIGGYWGSADRRDIQRPRRGMGPPGGGRGPGGFGGPPPPFDR